MNKEELIKAEAEDLLKQLNIPADVAVSPAEQLWRVQIQTEEDSALLIGKYGETLNSLERVLEAILFQQCGEKVELMINVNDYRERQKARLENIAANVAERVRAEKQPVPLRLFSAYERKVIHEYIAQNYPDLASYSEGEGSDRTLMVVVKE